MKRTAIIFFLALLAVTFPTRAADFLATEHYTLAADAALTNELWIKAQTVVMAGTAEDDLFVLTQGSTATATNGQPALLLTGAMQADVWGIAESIILSGPVSRHARLVGFKSVSIEGPVGRNLMVLGGTVVLNESAAISGDALLMGRDVQAHGTVHGNASLYGTQVTVSGCFDNNVTVTAPDINIMPGTHIGGNLYYTMDEDLVLDSEVSLGGKLIKVEPKVVERAPTLSLNAVMVQIGLYGGALLVGMAFIAIFPGIVAMSVHKLSASPWRCLLIGFVTFSLVPMVALFLILTIIGLPLCVVTAFAYLIMVYVGKIVTAIYLGHVLLRGRNLPPSASLLPMLASGLLILYAGGCLPFPIDILLWFAFTLLGLGGLVSAILDRRMPVVIATPPPLP